MVFFINPPVEDAASGEAERAHGLRMVKEEKSTIKSYETCVIYLVLLKE